GYGPTEARAGLNELRARVGFRVEEEDHVPRRKAAVDEADEVVAVLFQEGAGVLYDDEANGREEARGAELVEDGREGKLVARAFGRGAVESNDLGRRVAEELLGESRDDLVLEEGRVAAEDRDRGERLPARARQERGSGNELGLVAAFRRLPTAFARARGRGGGRRRRRRFR